MQRGFLGILVLFTSISIGIIIAGYVYFTKHNQSATLKSANSPTQIPVKNIITLPPATEIPRGTTLLSLLSYTAVSDEFITGVPYPKEITALSKSAIRDIYCSKQLEMKVYESTASSPMKVLVYDGDNEVSSLVPKDILSEMIKKDAASVMFCDDENRYIVVYEFWGGGGGSQNKAFVGVAKKQPFDSAQGKSFTFTEITTIDQDAPYFGCQKILALTNNNILYLECGGGDVGYSESIYKIDLANKEKVRIFNCGREFIGDNELVDLCVDEKGEEVYRSQM